MQTKHQFICGQCSAPVAAMRYGRLRKPVARVGCGAVALYNARVFLGRAVDFEALLREMERLRMPWLFGLFGTKPLSLRRYLRKNNIPFENYFSLRHFIDRLRDGKIGIVCAWNEGFRGMHFYCVYAQNSRLRSVNFISCDTVREYDFSRLTAPRFVTGYIL